ncbi:hypothetical protein [Psychrobacillus sp. FSL H8-0484]
MSYNNQWYYLNKDGRQAFLPQKEKFY